MVQSLDSAISIFGMAGRPHMEPCDARRGCKCLQRFLLSYQVLADRALQQQRLLWKVRPNAAYICPT